jgi:hypothetical protein
MAGRYDNPIPIRFLAPIDCLKIPALAEHHVQCRENCKYRHSTYMLMSRHARTVVFSELPNKGNMRIWNKPKREKTEDNNGQFTHSS